MRQLSLPLEHLRERYDVVVVGSGYGGSIAASRLSRAGRSVCVLERGRELHPGDFPNTLGDALREFQIRSPRGRFGSRSALFDLHAGHDLSVLVGCGLGGTSLINAGVALRPPAWVYQDERWPVALRERGDEVLAPFFDRAETMLGSTPYPIDWREPPKLAALGRAARAIGAAVERPPINVTFRNGANAAGVEQVACNLCGDCVSGCNYGAKNTLAMNYLPDAVAHGAHVFTDSDVETVLPAPGGGWIVTFEASADGRARFGAPALFVHADVVVVGAGALGSTQILLRSRAAGLPLSPTVGERFSGNGDVLAFAYDAADDIVGIGSGRLVPSPGDGAGPCITGMINLTGVPRPGQGLLIEEGVIPGALSSLMPGAFAVAADLDDGGGPLAFARRLWRRSRATVAAANDARAGRRGSAARSPASRRSLTYLVMSDDSGDGRLHLDGDDVRVEWTGLGDHPAFDRGDEVLQRATAGLGATFVRNPLWSPMLHESLVTVHPLGGCAMGDDGARGVVDDRGRVFSGQGDAVHDGLLVVDGSIVPRPLAVNPLLTISALAERACALLAAEKDWVIDGGPTPRLPDAPPTRPGLRFTERMRGFAAPDEQGDPEAGAARGRSSGTPLDFVLTIAVDDLPALLDDPSRPGRLSGTVSSPALSATRLRVVDGSFRLLQEDRTHVDTWLMRYSMRLLSTDGHRFRFEGTKTLRDRAGLDAWGDTTTLRVTITDEADGTVAAAGVLHISPGDFARQLTTMRVTGVEGAAERMRWLLRFQARFLRGLLKVYGGPLDGLGAFPASIPSPIPLNGNGRRRLRLPAPEPRWCDGDGRWREGNDVGDDAWLRLTRFEGGRRGPVLLAPGFGMAATSFLAGTAQTNLAEHLVERGYDVWLFDYRASIDLPSAHTSFTLDDIAAEDWPTAVGEVLRVTDAGSVQALGHCVGSASLMMALASGLAGVRSAVCMQFTLDPVTSYLNQVKSALGVGNLMARVGIRRVAPVTGGSVGDYVLDLLLRAVPVPRGERCGKTLCRWINAIYGCTHHHDQLDDATHDELDRLFGVGNLTALRHMSRIMQRRAVVDSAGRDVYRAHPERLNLPILLMQGRRNHIFHPEGSLRTLRWLQAANDPALYERVVLDGYAHLDALIGRDAARDVFPTISNHLDRFNR